MADEDEIDVLGDFSFNSCLAQNNQGIPSCSDREDTVHPQWLEDSTAPNWYDFQNRDKASFHGGPSRKLSGSRRIPKVTQNMHSSWTLEERKLLVIEMIKYGRNTRKISQTITTKTEAEIQALIEAEYGVHLETLTFGIEKTSEDHDDVPSVVQEEIVTDKDSRKINDVISMITTGAPTVSIQKKVPLSRKTVNRTKASLLKPDIMLNIETTNPERVDVTSADIYDEDDLILGSTVSVEAHDNMVLDMANKKVLKGSKHETKPKLKVSKKIGNHRRKHSGSIDKTARPRNKSNDNLKSPQNRQRKDSSLSEDCTKSPKLQLVFSSGHALPVSEGEQVIKLEKKKDSDSESDIEVDVDSDNSDAPKTKPSKDASEPTSTQVPDDTPIDVPFRKFEPMPRRQKRINLDGEGGYTIMHTERGDLLERRAEPRRERAPARRPVPLLPCRVYNVDMPAPYSVSLHVSALVAMDVQAHASRAEVMGLAGGVVVGSGGARRVELRAYRRAAAAAATTHCDMDPVSQAAAAESIQEAGLSVVGWHHSHPAFPADPSALDLRTQAALQHALDTAQAPTLGLITSQHWGPGRVASTYRCIRVEMTEDGSEAGFQLSVRLVPDLTVSNLTSCLSQLRSILREEAGAEHAVDMKCDICPLAGVTYLEKCISSISHHMHSAGYSNDDPVVVQLVQGLRDIFR